MSIPDQIKNFFVNLPANKRIEMETLHRRILELLPDKKLWYLDGRDETGKVVTNPTIGYGEFTKKYADGSEKAFFQIGISPNTSGISVYVMGIEDKHYLPSTYGKKIGKAKVTGYCIRFKTVNDINLQVLEAVIMDGVTQTNKSRTPDLT